MTWPFTAAAVAVTFLVGTTPPPGAINPTVTKDNLAQTICRHGWTTTVRPSFAWTGEIKRRSLPPSTRTADYELDHMIPLELGGSPDSPANLWLQPWNGPCGAHAKDQLENQLRREVCAGTRQLADAQATIVRQIQECKP